ncbi:MAG: hypothetical protein HKM89_10405, partial [Gemmatimonadales bacterium]|nr:hypothetical protein [Gemmatimonadales bacterium]
MTTYLTRLAFGSLLLAAAPVTVHAQGGDLPDGRAVINRFIEAIGGEDAVLKQTGRHMMG